MAWLYQRGGKWWVGYRHNGRQVLRSTKKSERAEAEKELAKVELLFGAHRAGSLTEELYQSLTGSSLTKTTLAAEIDDWLAEARATAAENTLGRYQGIATEFRTFLNATETGPALSAVTTDDVRRFLNETRARAAASTANLYRKILSSIFIRAVKNHHLRQNPVSPIKPFKKIKGENRVARPGFSLEELARVYATAPDEFWRAMVCGGFYTGLRLGDLINLRWGAVDLNNDRLILSDEKTGKSLHIPIAKPLRGILASARATAGAVKPSGFVWPEQAARHEKNGTGSFSTEFYNQILTPCGLVEARDTSHKATGKGRARKRRTNDVSFHSIRHSFVSFLRSTGSNQAVAKELAGHASDQVNSLYTHVPEAALVSAINLLPEFVK